MNTKDVYKAYMYSYPHKTAYGKLDDVNLFDYLGTGDCLDLYVHIPFCKTKCGYCNLFSVTGWTELSVDGYLDAMERQISQIGVNPSDIGNITIGGGTPLYLSTKQLSRLFRMIPGIDASRICVETAPNETVSEKLELLKYHNVNRVSIGIQSFLDSELGVLKRAHNSSAAHDAMAKIRDCDFDTVNVDLIYGIPNQTEKTLQASLEQTLAYAPNEIFLYPLYVREGTGLFGTVANPRAYEMYLFGRDYLADKGYSQISMRHFVLEESAITAGFKQYAKHSISHRAGRGLAPAAARNCVEPELSPSCGFERVLAIGCGGRSYLGDLHFCQPYATQEVRCSQIIKEYIDTADYTRVSHGIILNTDEHKRRFAIKNLLHSHGLSRRAYREAFGSDPANDFSFLAELAAQGHTVMTDDFIRLTPVGLSLSDAIGPLFISPEMRKRMRCGLEARAPR